MIEWLCADGISLIKDLVKLHYSFQQGVVFLFLFLLFDGGSDSLREKWAGGIGIRWGLRFPARKVDQRNWVFDGVQIPCGKRQLWWGCRVESYPDERKGRCSYKRQFGGDTTLWHITVDTCTVLSCREKAWWRPTGCTELHLVSAKSTSTVEPGDRQRRCNKERKCADTIGTVPIQSAQCRFSRLAVSNAKMLILIFPIKYTQAILSNSTRKLLWCEITKMPVAVSEKNYCFTYYNLQHIFVPRALLDKHFIEICDSNRRVPYDRTQLTL